MYLLVLPLGFALVWLFAVQIVYATPNDSTLANKADNDPLFQGDKMIGTVVSFEKHLLNDIMHLRSNNKIYLIELQNKEEIMSKVKVGDKLTVLIHSAYKISGEQTENPSRKKTAFKIQYIYVPAEIINFNNITIYKCVIKKHAFLYESNRARFANGKIKYIQSNSQGYIDRLVLNDGEFTITFDLTGQQLKNNKFQKGDDVLVKFIGEKLVAPKSYSTTELIVLYSQPKGNELRNNLLFNKFYYEDGKQR